jgi:hypothetical protein
MRPYGRARGWGSGSSLTRILDKIVTFANPKGNITNSYLELVASVTHHDLLTKEAHIHEATAHNLSDSMAMVW